MACATCALAVDDDRAERGGIRVANGKLLEAVIANEFLSRLAGVIRLRIRADRACGKESFFHVMPAARPGMRIRALLGNGGSAPETRVDSGIDRSRRMNFRDKIAPDDARRTNRPGTGMIIKSGRRADQAFAVDGERGREQAGQEQVAEKPGAFHSAFVCRRYAIRANNICDEGALFLVCTWYWR